jgi:hypothetical protein
MLSKHTSNALPFPREAPSSALTDDQLVQQCLAEAGNDARKAFRHACKHARGARLRVITARIGTAILQGRAS